MLHVENGLIDRGYECTENLARANCRESKVTIFESLEQYVKESSGFSDLVFQNFKYIFQYYFLLCSLVFVAFYVHHLVKYVRKNAILIRSRLELFKDRISLWKIWRFCSDN